MPEKSATAKFEKAKNPNTTEASLRRASSKFEQRFTAMEALATASGKSLHQLSAPELDRLWEAAKQTCGDAA